MRGRPDRYPERVLTSPRSRSLRLAAAVAALAPVLAACGMSVQTTRIYQPGVGVNARDGQVDVIQRRANARIAAELASDALETDHGRRFMAGPGQERLGRTRGLE